MSTASEVKVWDPLVRVFHWALVAGFFTAYFTEDDLLDIHVIAGYTVLGLVLFRVVWGVIGTRHARFTDFVTGPTTAWQYVKDTVRGTAKRFIGHNPAGGLMIVLLLVSLLGVSFSGLAIYGVDKHAGPLASWFVGAGEASEDLWEELHEFFANFTLVLVGIHVLGVIVESLAHRENLTRAMVTGKKRS